MRLCRVKFMIVLRPRAIRHKFRLGTGFTAAFLARQVPTSGRRKTAAKTDSRGWTPFRRPLRYRIQAMDKDTATGHKKCTAYSRVRRGRPKGVPL